MRHIRYKYLNEGLEEEIEISKQILTECEKVLDNFTKRYKKYTRDFNSGVIKFDENNDSLGGAVTTASSIYRVSIAIVILSDIKAQFRKVISNVIDIDWAIKIIKNYKNDDVPEVVKQYNDLIDIYLPTLKSILK